MSLVDYKHLHQKIPRRQHAVEVIWFCGNMWSILVKTRVWQVLEAVDSVQTLQIDSLSVKLHCTNTMIWATNWYQVHLDFQPPEATVNQSASDFMLLLEVSFFLFFSIKLQRVFPNKQYYLWHTLLCLLTMWNKKSVQTFQHGFPMKDCDWCSWSLHTFICMNVLQ